MITHPSTHPNHPNEGICILRVVVVNGDGDGDGGCSLLLGIGLGIGDQIQSERSSMMSGWA